MPREGAVPSWPKDIRQACCGERHVDRVLDALEQIRPIAEAHDATMAQTALAWTVAQPGITSAIVGARTPQQAVENAQAGDIQLTPGELTTIRAAFEELGPPVG